MTNQQSLFDEDDDSLPIAEPVAAPRKPPGTYRLELFEDCQSAIDQLFQQSFATQGSSAFDEFIEFARRFSYLSVYNAMLVRVQRPGAIAVAGRAKWLEVGRKVQPGAIPVVILQPFGPVRFIFEMSDTVGPPLPGENANPLYASGNVSRDIWSHVVAAAYQNGVKVEQTHQYGTLLAGTASGQNVRPEWLGTAKGPRWLVKVNAKHDVPTKFATLAHELGHVYCGHIGEDPQRRWPNRAFLARSEAELEAEAVAWLVCNRNGIVTRSNEYLSSLIGQADMSKVSMYSIFEASNRVEARSTTAATPKRAKRAAKKAKSKVE